MKSQSLFTMSVLALLATASTSHARGPCPDLDRAVVMAKVRQAPRIDEAMAIRRSYEPQLCSLRNLEIVSAFEDEGSSEPFPAYKSELSGFVLEELRKRRDHPLDEADAMATLRTVLKRVYGVDRVIVRYVLGPWARNCGELVALVEAVGAERVERSQAFEAFRSFQDSASCEVIRF